MVEKRLEHLFKSSLPLEHEVAALSRRCGFFNCGEFSYSRSNESGIPTEFSVDLHMEANLHSSEKTEVYVDLNVLIECKYSSPTVEWVFSTTPGHEPIVMSGFSCFPWTGEHMLMRTDRMLELEPQAYCTRGVSVSASSADPTAIKHGLNQLRYALPNLLRSILTSYNTRDEAHPVPVIAPLLVTNAPLLVLNADLPSITSTIALSLSEITTRHSHLCVYQKAGPELIALCRKVADQLVSTSGYPESFVEHLETELIDSVESIPVVTLDQLANHLTTLRAVVGGMSLISRAEMARRLTSI